MKSVLLFKFIYHSTWGGGEKHTVEMVEDLVAHGTRVYFVGSCTVLLKEFRKRKWPVMRFWIGKEPVAIWSLLLFPITFIVAVLTLTPILLYYRIANGVGTLYCLSLTEKVVMTPIARLCGMRVIWAEHIAVDSRRWLRLSPLRPLYVLWSRLVTVMAISKDVHDSLVRIGVSARYIRIIYNGVDVTQYHDFHRHISHWTKQFILGSIGRLEPEKGYVYLLRAFQSLLPYIPYARLILVGDGSERAQLEWLARQLGIDRSVQFVGFQQSGPGWYTTFDCFVLSSVGRESFGIVLLEALAATCPVVATRLGGIPEIIQDGVNGTLVEPANAEDLMHGILAIYQHPDLALHRAVTGHDMVVDRFSKTTMLDQLRTLFA